MYIYKGEKGKRCKYFRLQLITHPVNGILNNHNFKDVKAMYYGMVYTQLYIGRVSSVQKNKKISFYSI